MAIAGTMQCLIYLTMGRMAQIYGLVSMTTLLGQLPSTSRGSKTGSQSSSRCSRMGAGQQRQSLRSFVVKATMKNFGSNRRICPTWLNGCSASSSRSRRIAWEDGRRISLCVFATRGQFYALQLPSGTTVLAIGWLPSWYRAALCLLLLYFSGNMRKSIWQIQHTQCYTLSSRSWLT